MKTKNATLKQIFTIMMLTMMVSGMTGFASAAHSFSWALTPSENTYVNGSAVVPYDLTVTNNGASDSIRDVEIIIPNLFTINSCAPAPAGWSLSANSTGCKYSAGASSDYLDPSEFVSFDVTVGTPGITNTNYGWTVVTIDNASPNQFESESFNSRVDASVPTTVTVDAFDTFYGPNSLPTVSGTASDANSGVANVLITLFDGTNYFDGAAFASATPVYLLASGTTTWTYNVGAITFTDGVTYTVTPIANDAVGNSATGASDSFEWDETDPVSSVDAVLPTYTTTSTFNVAYTATDVGGSGVDYVELWYKKDAGVFTKYGDFTTSPISFDSSTTGGDGTYEFYTVAFDEVANEEAAPGVADDSTIVDTTAPTGTLSVDTDPVFESDLTLIVTVTYDEMMDSTGPNPTISFSGNAGAIVSAGPGAWSVGDTVWTESFTVTNADEENTVTVSSANAEDLAGNAEGTSNSDTFEIDTHKPTISSATIVPDPAKAGSVTVTLVFDEAMDTGASPVVTITGLTSSPYPVLQSSYLVDTWVGTFTLADDDEQLITATVDVDATAQDVAGNNMVADANVETFQADTFEPSVTSVVVSDSSITDADDGNLFTVTVDYSENMNTAVNPSVTFDPAVATTLTACGNSWTDANTFVYNCTIDDAGVTQADVDVDVSGAEDVAGNVQNAYAGLTDAFDVDTLNPTVVISVSDSLINEADDTLTFTVTMDYSEAMNVGVMPTVSFSPAVASTLTGCVASNVDADTFEYDCVVDDADVEVDDVDVTVSDAQDFVGNVQVQNTLVAAFDIDTIKPEVVSATANPDPATDGTVTITVVFSEDMNTGAAPTVTVEDLDSSSYPVTQSSYSGNTWIGIFTLLDDDEEEIGRITVSGGQDVALNTMIANTNAGTFQADTLEPFTSSININHAEFRDESLIAFTGIVIDGVQVDAAYLNIYDEDGLLVAGPYSMYADDGAFDETSEFVYIYQIVDVPADGVYAYTITGEDTAGNLEVELPTFSTQTFTVDADALEISYSNPEIDAMVNALNASIINLRSGLNNLSVNVSTLHGEVDVLQSDVSVLYGNVSSHGVRISSLENQMVVVQGNLTSLSLRTLQNEQDIDALQTDVINLQNNVSALSVNVSSLHVQANGLTVAVNSINSTVNSLVTVTTDHTNRLNSLNASVLSHANVLASLASNDSALNARINTLNSTLISLSADVAQAEADISTLQSQMSTVLSNLTVVNSNMTAMNSRLIIAEQDIASLQTDLDDFMDDVTELLSFVITDNTADSWTSMTGTLSVSTNRNALCEWVNEIDSADGSFSTTDNLLHTASGVSASVEGINVFTATCTVESSNFGLDYVKDKLIVFTVNTADNYNYVQDLNANWNALWLPNPTVMVTASPGWEYDADWTLKEVFDNSGIAGNYQIVWYYNGASWIGFTDNSISGDDTLTTAYNTNNNPYWILMDSADRFEAQEIVS